MTTDQNIREAIAAQIELAAPLAVVWNRWVLGLDASDWAAVMRSPDDQNRVHGYTVSRRTVQVTGEMSNHVSRDAVYVIVGVHYHLIGNGAGNSEDLFKAEVDAIVDQFALHDPAAPDIATHTELQIVIEGFQQTGAELVHWVVGELTILSC